MNKKGVGIIPEKLVKYVWIIAGAIVIILIA